MARTVVANSGNIPRDAVQTLRDVILQRKKASEHYKSRSGYKASSVDGHLHIIEVLEQVLRIFEGAALNKRARDRYQDSLSYVKSSYSFEATLVYSCAISPLSRSLNALINDGSTSISLSH